MERPNETEREKNQKSSPLEPLLIPHLSLINSFHPLPSACPLLWERNHGKKGKDSLRPILIDFSPQFDRLLTRKRPFRIDNL